MAKLVSITVCVVALTQTDYDHLEPDFRKKLDALDAMFDFKVKGRPYAASPDEWEPFEKGLPIRKYLEKANLKASLLSAQLFDPDRGAGTMRDTYLFIIDPLVLAHTQKRDLLIREVQATINAKDKSAFCIILPIGLPADLRAELTGICVTQLKTLYGIRKRQENEWPVEDADRLETYLARLSERLLPKADPGALAQAQLIYLDRGVTGPNLLVNPQLTS